MDSSADQFLRNATSGFNRWWVWIVGIVSIVVIWMGIGAIPSLASCEFVKSANLVDFTCDDSIIEGTSTLPAFVLSMYGFVLAMIGIWIVVRLLHKKPLTAMLTARPRFDYNRATFRDVGGISGFRDAHIASCGPSVRK